MSNKIKQPLLKEQIMDSNKRYCRDCGSVTTPRTRTKGSFLLEIVLWCMFLFPGILYTVWRLTTTEKVCRMCGSSSIIPTDSPIARWGGSNE